MGVWRLCFWSPIVLALCVARQVTQSYLPRVCAQRESQLDEKERKIQEKLKAKLNKKEVKKNGVKEKMSVLPQIDNSFNVIHSANMIALLQLILAQVKLIL